MIRRNYELPPTYSLSSEGCGSFLEPPNHPRYKTKSVYTQYGNNPRRGPNYEYNGMFFDDLEEVDRLFKPLPYDDPKVKAWEEEVYAYFKNCYSQDGKDRVVDRCIIHVKKDSTWTKNHPRTWTTTPQPPENHLAYLKVKETYPNAKPRLDLI